MTRYPKVVDFRRALEARLKSEAESAGSDYARLRRIVVFDRIGARLSASDIVLVGNSLTIEEGASLSTIGRGRASFDSSDGYLFQGSGVLALSNGWFNLQLAVRSFDARLAPNGKYLYVVDAGLDAVSVLAVDGGNLTELSASPVALPAGATPFGIVVTASHAHDD